MRILNAEKRMINMYKAVIFDLDGTLLNTLDDLANAGNYALKKAGLPVHETEKYKTFVGNGIPKLIERILPSESPRELYDRVYADFSSFYELHSADLTRPYDGLTELLAFLHAEKVRTAVVTNKADVFSNVLVKRFYGDNVELVIGQREGLPKKPDPAAINMVVERFGFDKADILYVGDSNVDMFTARNAGLASCGVLWGFRDRDELLGAGARFLAGNSGELKTIICSGRCGGENEK